MSDLGLFGPDSVTWRVHADPVLALAGIRAVFLQATHPLAMAGVAAHSGFRTDPWGRLVRTAEYVSVVGFGTTEQARRAGARVRALHRGRTGVEPESGTAYRVDDPHLLRWVHCCEVESFLTTFQRAGGRLSKEEADAYLSEQTRAAELVGLDPGSVPASVAQMADYFADMRPELRVTAEARRSAVFLLWPPMPLKALPVRAPWTGFAAAAFGLLPRWARGLYRLPDMPATDLAATAYARWFRRTTLLLPSSVRDGPALRDARRRAG